MAPASTTSAGFRLRTDVTDAQVAGFQAHWQQQKRHVSGHLFQESLRLAQQYEPPEGAIETGLRVAALLAQRFDLVTPLLRQRPALQTLVVGLVGRREIGAGLRNVALKVPECLHWLIPWAGADWHGHTRQTAAGTASPRFCLPVHRSAAGF